MHRGIVDLVLVIFYLPDRMNGTPCTTKSIVMEDDDDWAAMTDDLCGRITHAEFLQLVFTYTPYIDELGIPVENACVDADDSTVCSTIHKGLLACHVGKISIRDNDGEFIVRIIVV